MKWAFLKNTLEKFLKKWVRKYCFLYLNSQIWLLKSYCMHRNIMGEQMKIGCKASKPLFELQNCHLGWKNAFFFPLVFPILNCIFLAYLDWYCHKRDHKLWPSLVQHKVVCIVLGPEREKTQFLLFFGFFFSLSSNFVVDIFEGNYIQVIFCIEIWWENRKYEVAMSPDHFLSFKIVIWGQKMHTLFNFFQ